jgi:hypothetical protein
VFLSTVSGRYWVELVDQVTVDWESLRMNHGIAQDFRETMRTRTVLPPVALAGARFFDCVRQDGVNWEMAISPAHQVVVSVARAASSLAAMPIIVSKVR